MITFDIRNPVPAPSPASVRRHRTMARIRQADAAARYEASRRAGARAHGYHGPLTRAEASRRQLARLAAR